MFNKNDKKQETPVEETYVYTGEKNYEPPKVDPWVSDTATAAVEEKAKK